MSHYLVLLYVIGFALLVTSLYLVTYETNLAFWENPESRDYVGTPLWTGELERKSKIVIYPYRMVGYMVGLVASAFFAIPTLTVKAVKNK